MGTNKRIIGLDQISDADILSKLSTLRLEVDSPDYIAGESKGLPITSISKIDTIEQGSQLVNKWLTEKAFTSSTATLDRAGISRFASDQEMIDRSAFVVLAPSHIDRAIDLLTESYSINPSNQAAYLAGVNPVGTPVVYLSVSKIGNNAFIEGSVNVTYPGIITDAGLSFFINNIPNPTSLHTINVSIVQSGRIYACGAVISAENNYVNILISAPKGMSFATSTEFIINAFYRWS